MSKYHNRKVRTSDGIVHDSKKEAIRWVELKLMERAGEITELERQKEFLLVPPQYEEITTGKGAKKLKKKLVERSVVYRADFVYHDKNGDIVVEDVKGVRTRDYILKRKLMLYVCGVRIKEV